MKQCTRCGEFKTGDEFYAGSSGKPVSPCRRCKVQATSAYHKANPEVQHRAATKYRENNLELERQRKRDYMRRRAWGENVEELYAEMYEAQGGVCAICRQPSPKRLHIDHCHTTGRVRSLTCSPCNTAIGLMKEDPERLRMAAEYCSGT